VKLRQLRLRVLAASNKQQQQQFAPIACCLLRVACEHRVLTTPHGWQLQPVAAWGCYMYICAKQCSCMCVYISTGCSRVQPRDLRAAANAAAAAAALLHR
jgi:hypothetical protein